MTRGTYFKSTLPPQDSQEEESESESAAAMLVVKNSWKKVADQAFPAELNMDECPPLRGYTESSIKPILKVGQFIFRNKVSL